MEEVDSILDVMNKHQIIRCISIVTYLKSIKFRSSRAHNSSHLCTSEVYAFMNKIFSFCGSIITEFITGN